VKLQILNLAVKLFLTNPEQTKLLCQYVLTLARYDQNYDIRDRSRLLRQVLFPQNENSKICEKAREIFLANKPAPLLVSKFIGKERFSGYSFGEMQYFSFVFVGRPRRISNGIFVALHKRSSSRLPRFARVSGNGTRSICT
jgi:hypothetical protein